MSTLPTEILLLIGQYVQGSPTDGDWNQTGVFSLLLCCRRFYGVFLPRLYETLRIGPFEFAGQVKFRKQTIPLIHTLCRDPPIGYLIHHLILKGLEGTDDFEVLNEDEHVQLDDDLIGDVLDTICEDKDEKDHFLMHLKAQVESAWLAILLTKIPNVRTMHLDYGYDPYLFQGVLIKAANRQRPFDKEIPFPHLHQVTISCYDKTSLVDADYALPFLAFPSVSKLTGIDLYEGLERKESGRFRPLDLPKGCSPIKEIRVFGYVHGLMDWIEASKALESFDLSFGHEAAEWEGDRFKARHFRRSLKSAEKTLKRLHVSFFGDYSVLRDLEGDYDTCSIPPDDRPVGSLVEFTVLESLVIPHRNLLKVPRLVAGNLHWGYGDGRNGDSEKDNSENEPSEEKSWSLKDILPTSLETLIIHECQLHALEPLIDDLLDLIAHGSKPFPNLRKIVLSTRDDGRRLPMPEAHVIEKLNLFEDSGESKGIHVDLRRFYYDSV